MAQTYKITRMRHEWSNGNRAAMRWIGRVKTKLMVKLKQFAKIENFDCRYRKRQSR